MTTTIHHVHFILNKLVSIKKKDIYSQQELVHMIYVIGESIKNVYAEKYLKRRHPHATALTKLEKRFERTGCVSSEKIVRCKCSDRKPS